MDSPHTTYDRSRFGLSIDFLITGAVWSIAGIVTAIFVWILADIAIAGLPSISINFLTEAPRNAGRDGGIFPIILSTLAILAVTMTVSVPLGVGTAILLSEWTRAESVYGMLVRRSLDVLAGVPSIVFGLFGNAFFCSYLGLGFSILSGGLTLSCMVLPILIRSAEEGFRSVPNEYRTGAAALGLSRTATLTQLLLPAAIPGIVVGLVLGIGRALAETAALIFTSGYVDRTPSSLLDSGRALSVHIFDMSMNVAGGDQNAYASAVVLITMLLIINATASWMAHHWLKKRILVT
ncbi:Phosphate transport system permease protein PstA [Roseimaritima multifibrata]|uniref:Phosphate transport system permease protein PstA n=1 Tax=Roseimaritima multifibrata TaxID=1930274 RepID=A0A517MI13_9BACT|nr:phosphate ABC transporter permease PstA [Roseimaritima multifibrata]QDS94521.1 Phosphate transport system permease protein PstA [Roseimaritima multifibrata]